MSDEEAEPESGTAQVSVQVEVEEVDTRIQERITKLKSS